MLDICAPPPRVPLCPWLPLDGTANQKQSEVSGDLQQPFLFSGMQEYIHMEK